MPNWVTNRIVFHGDQENIDRVLQYIKGNGSKIDFNKIIPMPDNIYRGDLGKRERELYGLNNWYDWSVANWARNGTRNTPHSTTRIRCGLIRRGAALYPYSISLQKYAA